MKKILAIIVCKIIRFIGKLFNKGSSLPGKIALKIDNNILSEVKLPKYVVAVTGSNGKTSTVEMIKTVLEKSGLSVAYNKEGSNQIEGVTTFILASCNLKGEVLKDVVLLESDERYARHTFKYFIPTHYVITNLYRDQMTRNGHPEWMKDIINESIHEKSELLLNCDDPLVNSFGNINSIYFGIEKFKNSTKENKSVYDDGKYCPICKGPLVYDYHHYGHIGKYNCLNCGYKNGEAKYKITDIDLEKGYLIIDDKYKINLALKSIYNAYNILATYSLCRELNIDGDLIVDALNNYILKNGRVKEFIIGNHKGTLLTSKHENSISYNQSLTVATKYNEDVTAFIMVDAISRKYFTSETSWLWDVDFELLKSKNIKKIILAGQYESDLCERLLYADINFNIVYATKDIEDAVDYLKKEAIGHVFVITCFADQDKLLSRVETL